MIDSRAGTDPKQTLVGHPFGARILSKSDFPYCVPDQRDLTTVESALLNYLIDQVDDIAVGMSELKVVARCSCGACPTILLGKSINDTPVTSKDSHPVKQWSGRAENGTLIGIGLFAKDGVPTELEAWSVDGGDIEAWPPIDAIRPI